MASADSIATAAPMLSVEVVCSPRAGAVDRVAMRLPAGSVVADALRGSGLAPGWANLSAIGIWGRPCALAQPLREGDRVELYRDLRIDPKDARRTRQRMQSQRGSAAGGRRAVSGSRT